MFRNQENKCDNKFMNVLEQIGRYASMFLMVFNIGIAEFGFSSVGVFLLYGFGNAFLILVYWIVWMLYFHKGAYSVNGKWSHLWYRSRLCDIPKRKMIKEYL